MLRRCRAWAAEIGEVRIGDDRANPTIAMQLSAVDTESILAGAGGHDNTGNRRRLIREILFGELGIEDRDELMLYHDVTWRGTQRRFEVIFANVRDVRELPDESLSTRGDERKVIVDFPFDEPGRTPADDLARLNDFRGRDARARTLVWLPSFLSASAQRDRRRCRHDRQVAAAAVREAREAGCEVIAVLALVDREEQDGASHIRKEVDIYIPLYRRSDFPRIDASSHALTEP